eukprot:5979133-Amphidinium_carterae.1
MKKAVIVPWYSMKKTVMGGIKKSLCIIYCTGCSRIKRTKSVTTPSPTAKEKLKGHLHPWVDRWPGGPRRDLQGANCHAGCYGTFRGSVLHAKGTLSQATN